MLAPLLALVEATTVPVDIVNLRLNTPITQDSVSVTLQGRAI